MHVQPTVNPALDMSSVRHIRGERERVMSSCHLVSFCLYISRRRYLMRLAFLQALTLALPCLQRCRGLLARLANSLCICRVCDLILPACGVSWSHRAYQERDASVQRRALGRSHDCNRCTTPSLCSKEKRNAGRQLASTVRRINNSRERFSPTIQISYCRVFLICSLALSTPALRKAFCIVGFFYNFVCAPAAHHRSVAFTELGESLEQGLSK
mmetsp:Transcript_13700/g.19936  ORF Transcript_13700/g.19936 Transcript_13700/m.19936 type:complete len:213 (-) Transcript_13700:525-1163(-)